MEKRITEEMKVTRWAMRSTLTSIQMDLARDEELNKWLGCMKMDDQKVQQATAWLESLPEDVINHGKWAKIRYNSGIKRYPEHYWDKYFEKFKDYEKRLAQRKQEILAVTDIKELMGMFCVFEVEEMLLYKPEIANTCPDFIFEACFRPEDAEERTMEDMMYPFASLEMLCT